MLRLLEKTGMVTVEDTIKTILVQELVAWVDTQFQEQLSKQSFHEEAVRYVRQLNDKKVMLEYQLEAGKKGPRSELQQQARVFISHISLPDPITFQAALALHTKLEPELEKLELAQDEEPENRSLGTAANLNNAPALNSLTPQLLSIQAAHDEFSERLAKSGLQTMKTILQKAATIEQYQDTFLRVEQELHRRTERANAIHTKKEEKDAELKSLQEHPRYFRLTAIAEERQRLLKAISAADSLAERFALKEKIDLLEKSVGDKDFIAKVDEARYRTDHFTQQDEKQQQELYELKDTFEEITARRTREIELFTNLVLMSLSQKVQVTI